MKIGIGIPTYNRYDLLEPSLKKYSTDFPNTQIFIVDNGHQNIFDRSMNIRQLWNAEKIAKGELTDVAWAGITLIENQENVGVGASWNQLCSHIFSKGCDYAVILNDDIYLGKNETEILEFIQKKKVGFMRATPDWCVFIISKDIYEKVGKFDECFFPAYYEDKSYEYRMKLKNIPVLTNPNLNPIIYRSSQSIEKDYSILTASKKNKKLFIEMWGGEPGKEKYKTRYNEK